MAGSSPRSNSWGRRAIAAAGLVLLGGCVRNASGPDYREVSLAETTFSFAAQNAQYDIFAEYRLVPGDVLDVLYHIDQSSLEEDFKLAVDYELTVKFSDLPELNETQVVRPDGTISLPYLGVVTAAGKTVSEFTQELQTRYRELAVGEFRIAVDHQVAVKFVELPELNETQVVRPDGTISLPYLGVVAVAGRTVPELTLDLKSRYAAILKAPELYVLVAEPRATWTELRKKLQNPNLHVLVARFRESIKEFKQDLHTAPRGLSRLVTVRPDGYATFALCGDLLVAGKTIPEIDGALDQKYEEILHGLSVDLFLEEHAGSLVYVLGNVQNPGSYPIPKPTPVMKALALAGGFLPGSEVDDIVVYRRHDGRLVATKIDLESVLSMDPTAQEFYVHPDDVIYVPRTALTQAGEVGQDLLSILLFRGWSVQPFNDFRRKK